MLNLCSKLFSPDVLMGTTTNPRERERERERERGRCITSDVVVTILTGNCPTVKTKIHRLQNKHFII